MWASASSSATSWRFFSFLPCSSPFWIKRGITAPFTFCKNSSVPARFAASSIDKYLMLIEFSLFQAPASHRLAEQIGGGHRPRHNLRFVSDASRAPVRRPCQNQTPSDFFDALSLLIRNRFLRTAGALTPNGVIT